MRVAVLAAAHRDHHPVPVGDHVEIHDRPPHGARELLSRRVAWARRWHGAVHASPRASGRGPPATRRAAALLDEREEREDAVTRRPLGVPADGPVGRRGAGDVRVDPVLRLADELAEEERGRDRSAPAIARVLQVGDVALQLLLQLLEERHAPHLLARLLHRGGELLGGLLVGSRTSPSRCCRARRPCARERRVVDEEVGLQLRAYASASARTRRPSASVLMISTDLPSSEPQTSPGR